MSDIRTDEEILQGKESTQIYWIPIAEQRKSLNNEQMGRLFNAILDYDIAEKEPDFSDDGMLKMLFLSIQSQLDSCRANYIKKSRRNSKNGKLGGINSGKVRKLKAELNEPNASTTKQDKPNASGLKQDEPNEADMIGNEMTQNEIKRDVIIGKENQHPTISILQKMLEEDFQTISKGATKEIFDSYFDKYESLLDKQHPELTQNEIDSLIREIPYITDNEGTIILSGESFQSLPDSSKVGLYADMIEEYFSIEHDSEDEYNIKQFFAHRSELLN